MALRWAADPVSDPIAIERGQKLANFLSQPFFVAEPWTHRPGSHVSLEETLDDCADILDGRHGDLSAESLSFGGSVAELRAKARRT